MLSFFVTSFTYFNTANLLEKGFFCRRFHRSEGPLQKNFLQINVEDLKFLLAQITFKYSKKRRETAAAPRVFTLWAHVDHPPLTYHYSFGLLFSLDAFEIKIFKKINIFVAFYLQFFLHFSFDRLKICFFFVFFVFVFKNPTLAVTIHNFSSFFVGRTKNQFFFFKKPTLRSR